MIKKKISIPIYPVNFTLIVFEKDKQLQKLFPGVEFEPELKSMNGFVLDYQDKLYMVLRKYKEGKKKYPTHGIIVHESNHLVNAVFQYTGMKLDISNDECQSYLLQWIFEKVSSIVK